MFTISKQFHFSASHILGDLPTSHPCARLHGHNYVVELILARAALNNFGFVVDYAELNQFKQILDTELDHRHLNDLFSAPPTAENLAYYLYQRAISLWPEVIAVRVSETPATWAEYRG